MKRENIHLKLLCIFLLLEFVNAYSQSSTWKINGNILSTGDFLGSNNNMPLVFKTNGVERGRFLSNGGFNINGFIEADSAQIISIAH